MNPDSLQDSSPGGGRGALLTGGVAAILASACCIGPLVLIALGVSGAWIGKLTALEPYQPVFVAASVIALFLAYRRIWRPSAACPPGQVCALPAVSRGYKLLFWLVLALLIAALGVPFIAPWLF